MTELLKEPVAEIRQWKSKVHYWVVYPDSRGKYLLRDIGIVESHRNAKDDFRTLDELRFQPGDFLAISIMDKQD